MLTKQERTELVRVDHTYDGEAVADLVRALLLRGRSLIEIELALRDAGCASYLIANGTGFEIVIGVRAARARLVARIVAERELAEVVRLSDQGTIASLIALAREGGVHLQLRNHRLNQDGRWRAEGGDALLDELYVRHRGQGAGSRLLVVALEGARAAGATRIFLETEAPNDAVRRFYRRHGFVDEDSVWLQRPL